MGMLNNIRRGADWRSRCYRRAGQKLARSVRSGGEGPTASTLAGFRDCPPDQRDDASAGQQSEQVDDRYNDGERGAEPQVEQGAGRALKVLDRECQNDDR